MAAAARLERKRQSPLHRSFRPLGPLIVVFGAGRAGESRAQKAAEAFAESFHGYLFSRRSRNGVASAMSDEWDPGRAYAFGRVEGGSQA